MQGSSFPVLTSVIKHEPWPSSIHRSNSTGVSAFDYNIVTSQQAAKISGQEWNSHESSSFTPKRVLTVVERKRALLANKEKTGEDVNQSCSSPSITRRLTVKEQVQLIEGAATDLPPGPTLTSAVKERVRVLEASLVKSSLKPSVKSSSKPSVKSSTKPSVNRRRALNDRIQLWEKFAAQPPEERPHSGSMSTGPFPRTQRSTSTSLNRNSPFPRRGSLYDPQRTDSEASRPSTPSFWGGHSTHSAYRLPPAASRTDSISSTTSTVIHRPTVQTVRDKPRRISVAERVTVLDSLPEEDSMEPYPGPGRRGTLSVPVAAHEHDHHRRHVRSLWPDKPKEQHTHDIPLQSTSGSGPGFHHERGRNGLLVAVGWTKRSQTDAASGWPTAPQQATSTPERFRSPNSGRKRTRFRNLVRRHGKSRASSPQPSAGSSGSVASEQNNAAEQSPVQTITNPGELSSLIDAVILEHRGALDEVIAKLQTGGAIVAEVRKVPGPYKRAVVVSRCHETGHSFAEHLATGTSPLQHIVWAPNLDHGAQGLHSGKRRESECIRRRSKDMDALIKLVEEAAEDASSSSLRADSTDADTCSVDDESPPLVPLRSPNPFIPAAIPALEIAKERTQSLPASVLRRHRTLSLSSIKDTFRRWKTTSGGETLTLEEELRRAEYHEAERYVSDGRQRGWHSSVLSVSMSVSDSDTEDSSILQATIATDDRSSEVPLASPETEAVLAPYHKLPGPPDSDGAAPSSPLVQGQVGEANQAAASIDSLLLKNIPGSFPPEGDTPLASPALEPPPGAADGLLGPPRQKHKQKLGAHDRKGKNAKEGVCRHGTIGSTERKMLAGWGL